MKEFIGSSLKVYQRLFSYLRGCRPSRTSLHESLVPIPFSLSYLFNIPSSWNIVIVVQAVRLLIAMKQNCLEGILERIRLLRVFSTFREGTRRMIAHRFWKILGSKNPSNRIPFDKSDPNNEVGSSGRLFVYIDDNIIRLILISTKLTVQRDREPRERRGERVSEM